jgi:NAD(P)-dependent dehydrogenase (short-subunit alcohol dehydrogenase family)
MNLSGRRAIVTGANGNLGRVIVSTLAELGADVILVDLPGKKMQIFAEETSEAYSVKAQCLVCDLESEVDRNNLISEVKSFKLGVDILVNNAAFVGDSNLTGWKDNFEEQSLETWRRAIEVNLTSAFHLCQAFTPYLKKSVGGSIINIASIYGQFGPDWRLYEDNNMGNPAAYGVSKGGLVQFTRWLATTIAPDVRVNSISPGGIFRNQPTEFVKKYSSRTPLGRMAVEQDFKGAIAFLASDLSSYLTGQILRVDGGWGEW